MNVSVFPGSHFPQRGRLGCSPPSRIPTEGRCSEEGDRQGNPEGPGVLICKPFEMYQQSSYLEVKKNMKALLFTHVF